MKNKSVYFCRKSINNQDLCVCGGGGGGGGGVGGGWKKGRVWNEPGFYFSPLRSEDIF